MSILLRLAVFSFGVFGSLPAVLDLMIGLMFGPNPYVRPFTYLSLLSALFGFLGSILVFIKPRAAGIVLAIAALGIVIFYLLGSVAAGQRPDPPGHSATPRPLEQRMVGAFKRAIPAVVPMVAASGLAFLGTRRREPQVLHDTRSR